jgi:hypothetical protein
MIEILFVSVYQTAHIVRKLEPSIFQLIKALNSFGRYFVIPTQLSVMQ